MFKTKILLANNNINKDIHQKKMTHNAIMAALTGKVPKGEKISKIEPLFSIPEGYEDLLVLPFHTCMNPLNPIDRDCVINSEYGILHLAYDMDNTVHLQRIGHLYGDISFPVSQLEELLTSEKYRETENDQEWITKAKEKFKPLKRRSLSENKHSEHHHIEAERNPLGTMMSSHAFEEQGYMLSATIADIAASCDQGRLVGYAPPQEGAKAMYVIHLEIPATKIIVPKQQIIECGGIKASRKLIFPDGINLDFKNLHTYGFFPYSNTNENEIVFAKCTPSTYARKISIYSLQDAKKVDEIKLS